MGAWREVAGVARRAWDNFSLVLSLSRELVVVCALSARLSVRSPRLFRGYDVSVGNRSPGRSEGQHAETEQYSLCLLLIR